VLEEKLPHDLNALIRGHIGQSNYPTMRGGIPEHKCSKVGINRDENPALSLGRLQQCGISGIAS